MYGVTQHVLAKSLKREFAVRYMMELSAAFTSQAAHVGQKIGNQKLYGLEDIPFLATFNVSMVALATLIVIAHEPLTACPITETVLELVGAAGHLQKSACGRALRFGPTNGSLSLR